MVRLNTILPLLATATIVQSSIISISSLTTSPSTKDDDDESDNPLPLIIWHGLGDNFAADGLANVASLADEVNPGTLVYMVRLADDPSGDSRSSFYGNLTEQVDQVCADLASHQIISTAPAIDALGFSQGGVFMRAYIERCNFPPVRSFVTFGSPHNGISEFQSCSATDWLCKGAQVLLRGNTWSSFVQSRLVPAQYFRDPLQYDNYLEYSNFLADINNERALKNQTYKENIEKLERFVLYKFANDTTVVPKDSCWFTEVNGTEVTELRERDMYKEDWLGLKTLDKKGVLKFETTEGGHMSLTGKLLQNVFKKYYGPFGRSFDDEKLDNEYSLQQEL